MIFTDMNPLHKVLEKERFMFPLLTQAFNLLQYCNFYKL